MQGIVAGIIMGTLFWIAVAMLWIIGSMIVDASATQHDTKRCNIEVLAEGECRGT